MYLWETIIINLIAPTLSALVVWLTMRRKQKADARNVEASSKQIEVATYTALVEPLKSTIQALEDRVQKLESENKRIMDQNIELLAQVHQLRIENLELKNLIDNFKRNRNPKNPMG